MTKIIDLKNYRSKKKNQTWLYTIGFHELFSEFIETYHAFEETPQSLEVNAWMELVSDALNERFFNTPPRTKTL